MSLVIWLIGNVSEADLYEGSKCCAWHRFSTLGSENPDWDVQLDVRNTCECVHLHGTRDRLRERICREETPPSHAGFVLSQECPVGTQSGQSGSSLGSACVSLDERKLSGKTGQLFREVFVLLNLHLQVTSNQSEMQVRFFNCVNQKKPPT